MAASIQNYVPQVAARAWAPGRAVGAWLLASVGALAFVALLFAAPVLESAGHGTAAWFVYHSFAPLCHQIAERSFYVAGHPLAVCARCTGVYAGFAACLLLYPLLRPLRLTQAPPRAWLWVAVLPTAVDFSINFTGLAHNTHLSRLVTGAWLGAGAVFFVMPGLVEIAQGYGRDHGAAPARGLFQSQVKSQDSLQSQDSRVAV
ncbi:MAG: DUF2085 domain-containing protein [Pyrinomonadaceae bacterium]